jgi:hypothetical protein
VDKLATPFTTATEPRLVKVTDPVAVLGVTVAVNVTLCPKADGFALDVKATVAVLF